MRISEAKPRMRVCYVPYSGCDTALQEYGEISSWNEKVIFVKFDKQLNKFGWDGTTSQACTPSDLFTCKADANFNVSAAPQTKDAETESMR